MLELVKMLNERGMHICFAESCTGGLLCEMLTRVPGASAVFSCGIVSYSNDMKIKLLSVSPETIASVSEVSAECASEMASGAAKASGAELALSVTGYAGPGGGTDKDPVGTVYIGVCFGKDVRAYRFVFAGDRDSVRQQTAAEAIKLAKNALSY